MERNFRGPAYLASLWNSMRAPGFASGRGEKNIPLYTSAQLIPADEPNVHVRLKSAGESQDTYQVEKYFFAHERARTTKFSMHRNTPR